MSIRKLPANANLDNLKKQAKTLLKAVKENDPATLPRIKPYFNDPNSMGLQDAQLVIARDYGFSSWKKMKSHIESGVSATQTSMDQLANEFLRYVVIVYSETESADPARWQHAAELLKTHPKICGENIYAATAIGDVEKVKNWLNKEPGLINRKGGFHNWEPLMYAAYARLPGVSTLEVGKLLIERGADPNAHYMWGGQYKFTALTGVFGQGEAGPENLVEHPEFEKFARLLLSAGANPNDSQAAYNRMFTEDNICLELLLEFGIASTDKNNWLLQENDKLVQHPQGTLHYQLCHAIWQGMMDRVKLLVEYGIDVNQPVGDRTPYEMALSAEHQEIADYLAANGARIVELRAIDIFRNACLKANRDLVITMLKENPNLIDEVMEVSPDILEKAVESGRPDAVTLMLDLDFDVNHVTFRTALHQAAWIGNIEMMKLLIEAGADPTLRDHFYFGPPLAWALQNKQSKAAEFLEQCEMDIFTAVALGKLDRIEQLLTQNPSLLEITFFDVRPNKKKPCDMDWMTPLAFAVSNNQRESVKFLLEWGASTSVNNGKGMEVRDIARNNANDEIVRLLERVRKE